MHCPEKEVLPGNYEISVGFRVVASDRDLSDLTLALHAHIIEQYALDILPNQLCLDELSVRHNGQSLTEKELSQFWDLIFIHAHNTRFIKNHLGRENSQEKLLNQLLALDEFQRLKASYQPQLSSHESEFDFRPADFTHQLTIPVNLQLEEIRRNNPSASESDCSLDMAVIANTFQTRKPQLLAEDMKKSYGWSHAYRKDWINEIERQTNCYHQYVFFGKALDLYGKIIAIRDDYQSYQQMRIADKIYQRTSASEKLIDFARPIADLYLAHVVDTTWMTPIIQAGSDYLALRVLPKFIPGLAIPSYVVDTAGLVVSIASMNCIYEPIKSTLFPSHIPTTDNGAKAESYGTYLDQFNIEIKVTSNNITSDSAKRVEFYPTIATSPHHSPLFWQEMQPRNLFTKACNDLSSGDDYSENSSLVFFLNGNQQPSPAFESELSTDQRSTINLITDTFSTHLEEAHDRSLLSSIMPEKHQPKPVLINFDLFQKSPGSQNDFTLTYYLDSTTNEKRFLEDTTFSAAPHWCDPKRRLSFFTHCSLNTA